EAVQRGADGHGHGAGTANAGAGRGFRIGHQRESTLWAEKLGYFGKERKAIALGLHERGEAGETFFTLDVARHQADGLATVGFDTAGSVEGDGDRKSTRLNSSHGS